MTFFSEYVQQACIPSVTVVPPLTNLSIESKARAQKPRQIRLAVFKWLLHWHRTGRLCRRILRTGTPSILFVGEFASRPKTVC